MIKGSKKPVKIGCGMIYHRQSSSGGRLVFYESGLEILGGFLLGADWDVYYTDIDHVEYTMLLMPKIRIMTRMKSDLPGAGVYWWKMRKLLRCFTEAGVEACGHHGRSLIEWFQFWYK